VTAPPTLLRSGKVRDLYDAGPDALLMVASDRVSAFDVVFAEPIPNKGRVLTAMTAFWCAHVADLVEVAMRTADPAEIADVVEGTGGLGDISGRAMLVRRAEMVPLECIVRGYLAGQAYEEYARVGTVHTMAMPAGLRLADRLPEPIFTPSTKAEVGHDENIDFDAAAAIVGHETASEVRDVCLALYERAAERAADAGFILADTKFEFGRIDGRLVLCDEVVTPDSSRLWPADEVVPGETPPSFDKQPLRDWAASQSWDRTPPPPPLPAEVVDATSARYVASYERVTGRSLADWYPPARVSPRPGISTP
jgi:phosphoribosylaminoimidazole-succinocarboxamide synthase